MNVQIRQGQYNDDYAYFDPKILRGNMDNIPRAKNAFQVGKGSNFHLKCLIYLRM